MNQELYTILYLIIGLITGSAISLYSAILICFTWKTFFLLPKMFLKKNRQQEDESGRFVRFVNSNIFNLVNSSFLTDEIKKKEKLNTLTNN